MDPDWRRICDEFVRATNYDSMREVREAFSARPAWSYSEHDPYLKYDAPACRVQLGAPEFPPAPSVWEVFRNRRTLRRFVQEPISLNQLNVLLWSAQGVTGMVERDGVSYQLRTAPSAGGLYPIETYLFVNSVEGLDPGLYHLDVGNWVLEGLRLADLREEAYLGLLQQRHVRTAAVNVIWTAVLPRCRAKYHERAYRYIWWDVGHISENLLMAATALGLGACVMGAWLDSLINQSLGIDGVEHLSVLTASVGAVEGLDWRVDRRS